MDELLPYHTPVPIAQPQATSALASPMVCLPVLMGDGGLRGAGVGGIVGRRKFQCFLDLCLPIDILLVMKSNEERVSLYCSSYLSPGIE